MRKGVLAIIVAIGLAYCGIIALAIGWAHDRSVVTKLQAEVAAEHQQANRGTASPVPSAAPLASNPSTAPAPSPTTFPRIRTLSDNLGNVWVTGTADSTWVPVAAGARIQLTAAAADAAGRAVQYKFWTGDVPQQHVLCDWGGPTCTWTAERPPGMCSDCTVHITVAIRATEGSPRLSTCFQAEPCDDMLPIRYLASRS